MPYASSVARRLPRVQQPRPQREVAAPSPKPSLAHSRTPVSHTGRSASGVPTYYCWSGRSICTHGYPDRAGVADFYAAAGPSLRVGSWRGRVVSVTANGRTIRVRLIDFCACGSGGHFLDLYHDAFVALGSPRHATVRW